MFPFGFAPFGMPMPPPGASLSKEYYDRLGVTTTASADDVKKAYRRLAVKHHPDKGGDAEQFKLLSEAYRVLSDERLRGLYDRFGPEAVKDAQGGAPASPFPFPGENGMASAFFGRRPSEPSMPVRKIKIDLPITDVYKGCTLQYRIKRKRYTDVKTCPSCKGTGKTRVRHEIGPMMVQERLVVCTACSGTAIDAENSAFEAFNEVIPISVPRGCPNGHAVTVPEKLDIVPGKPVGAVQFILSYDTQSCQAFDARPDDAGNLHLEISVSLEEALVGFVRHASLPSTEEIEIISSWTGNNVFADVTSVHGATVAIEGPWVKRVQGMGLPQCAPNDATHVQLRDLFIHIKITASPLAWSSNHLERLAEAIQAWEASVDELDKGPTDSAVQRVVLDQWPFADATSRGPSASEEPSPDGASGVQECHVQ